MQNIIIYATINIDGIKTHIIPNIISIGENTQNHDQLITPHNFNTINIIVSKVLKHGIIPKSNFIFI